MSQFQITLLLCILLNAVFWIVVYMRMVHYVSSRGVRFNLFHFEFMYPYFKKYKALRDQDPNPGPNLIPTWLISINLNLVLVVLFMLSLLFT